MRNLSALSAPTRAIVILAAAGAAAFAVSTAAVSSTTTSLAAPAVKHPFVSFSFTGGVSTSRPARPSTFALTFRTTFTLSANSPGIVNPATGTLDNVTVTERVSYPVPATSGPVTFVGPALLPFRSDKLALVVAIKGTCFVPSPAGGSFVLRGGTRCASSKLTLGGKTFKVSSLLKSITGSFAPVPGAVRKWTGSMTASFASPGYTFPVATLGSGGGTQLVIGSNGATRSTRSVVFAG